MMDLETLVVEGEPKGPEENEGAVGPEPTGSDLVRASVAVYGESGTF